MFNTNVPFPRINPKNFAVNGRIYNTNKTGTLLPSDLQALNVNNSADFIGSLSSNSWSNINT